MKSRLLRGKSRTTIGRFTFSDLSFRRLFSAASRRVTDFPHFAAWHLTARAERNRVKLQSYRDRHLGKRCFVIGNGPSLSSMDLEPLANEVTFGMNRLYLLFARLALRPTYYVCVNELVLEQFVSDIAGLTMPKFLNWNRRHLFGNSNPQIAYLKLSMAIRDNFRSNLTRSVFTGATVTYVTLQIAYYMGFSQVILIGVDHNYSATGIPNTVVTQRKHADPDHFHPNYFPKGMKWQLPDLRRSELAYRVAKGAYEEDGRRILDATVNGKCPVFDKIDYGSLF